MLMRKPARVAQISLRIDHPNTPFQAVIERSFSPTAGQNLCFYDEIVTTCFQDISPNPPNDLDGPTEVIGNLFRLCCRSGDLAIWYTNAILRTVNLWATPTKHQLVSLRS